MKCNSCGYDFDEEKYYRICPKCGTYHNGKDDSNSKNIIEKEESNRKSNRKLRDSIKENQLVGMLILFIVLAIVTTIAYTSYLKFHAYKEAMKVSYDTFEMENNTVLTTDRKIIFENGFFIHTDELIGLPKGKELIFIPVSIEGDESNYEDETQAPYIQYQNIYKEVIDRYDIENYLDYIGLDENSICSNYGFLSYPTDKEYLVYLVDQGIDEVTLGLELRKEKGDFWKVKQLYTTKIELTERKAGE